MLKYCIEWLRIIPVSQLTFTITQAIRLNIKGYSEMITVNQSQNFWGHAVAQLVEALLYKQEGSGFGSRFCHWNFSLT
jgi:ATP adenylyltransferase/5',5'''-P-1,P-4-tetraphosphate phosphorylase II